MQAQEEANEAAEKRIAVLEKQMQSLEQQGNASDGAVKAIKK